MQRSFMLAPALVAALFLGACGGGGETGDTGSGGGGDTAAGTTLSLVDNEFQPSDLSVSSGDSVEVTNDGQSPHTVTIEGESIDEEVESGASTTITFDLEPGDYIMYCEFHREGGMEGTLTVS
jgi:peptide/nickel transport system substrate-binding protein